MNNILQFKKVKFMKKITKERMLEIEKIVKDILLKSNIDTDISYIDIVSLVKKDGFIVQPMNMPIATTGCLFVDDTLQKPERLIMVNKKFKNPDNEDDVVFKKSRFITAHEYGHYILHKSYDKPLYAHRDSDKRDTEKELEADYFARSLLMPLEKFKSYYKSLKNLSEDDDGNDTYDTIIKILSLIFRVTKNKVEKRIDDLMVLE